MAKLPNPNKPITHINPPTVVPDRLPPQKPGTFDPKLPVEQQWPYVEQPKPNRKKPTE